MTKIELEKIIDKQRKQIEFLEHDIKNISLIKERALLALVNLRGSIIRIGYSVKDEFKDIELPLDKMTENQRNFWLNEYVRKPHTYLRLNNRQIAKNSFLYEYIMEFDNTMNYIENKGGKND